MIRKIKYKLIQYLVKNLLVAVSEQDILTITNRGWLMGKRKLQPEEVNQIKEDAKFLLESELWRLISTEIRWLANLRMFEKGHTEDNTMFGRAMLYNLQTIETFIQRCKKL